MVSMLELRFRAVFPANWFGKARRTLSAPESKVSYFLLADQRDAILNPMGTGESQPCARLMLVSFFILVLELN